MRIAIVGAGISGLVCAHLLHRDHEVTVFEAADHIGGHTNTVDVEDPTGTVPVDTGFIVFNEVNYPNFVRLLEELGVESRSTRMGFSVRDDRDGTEYAGASLGHVYAQKRNLLKPGFHRMVYDLLRFYREAPGLLEGDDQRTLGQYLRQNGYGRRFVEQHIVPMGAALWSCSERQMDDFPARFFVQFMHNHRMLHLKGRPGWRVIEGGSREYVKKMVAPFREKIHLGTPVETVDRDVNGVTVKARGHEAARFDRAILACHSDQALRLLGDDATDSERQVLGAIPYSVNDTVLHTDTRVLPRTPKTWSSWNYRVRPDRDTIDTATVTYHMNQLQSLQAERDYCVTLNDHDLVDDESVLRRFRYEHPQYTTAGVAAQQRYDEISGIHHTWFCGAYWGWGFHEDGVRSALRVCEDFGARLGGEPS
ncbi:MAG TPA: FAD-dependent oxidoreductase [Candidatus Krumholzibacteria bacterium]|nr:FAD-dependent oxidoreductase [Candidatus Krumholzibacteria bacterium]